MVSQRCLNYKHENHNSNKLIMPLILVKPTGTLRWLTTLAHFQINSDLKNIFILIRLPKSLSTFILGYQNRVSHGCIPS